MFSPNARDEILFFLALQPLKPVQKAPSYLKTIVRLSRVQWELPLFQNNQHCLYNPQFSPINQGPQFRQQPIFLQRICLSLANVLEHYCLLWHQD